MPSLSSVIKAGSVRLEGTVQCPAIPAPPSSLPVADDPVVSAGDSKCIADAQAHAAMIVAAAELRRDEILEEAGRQSDEMLKQADIRILAMEEEARRKGYDNGYLEGLSAGQREAGRLQREANQFLSEVKAFREDVLRRLEPQMVELAVCVAEKLVSRQLDIEPDTIVSILKEALRQVKEAGEVIVRLHPDDVQACRARIGELQAEMRQQSALSLLSDNGLDRGCCRVETNGALIECLLDERFESLRKTLADVAGHA